MYKILLLFVLLSNVACSQSNHNGTEEYFNNSEKCKNSFLFGDTKICLPQIEGMRECYSIPSVKSIVDKYEDARNSTIAFYVTDSTYNRIEKFGEFSINDYFKIYSPNIYKGLDLDLVALNDVATSIENGYIQENWDYLNNKIEKKVDFMSIGKPILIETYSLCNNTKTFILLTKVQASNDESLALFTINLILIKNRLIWLAYYKFYENIESFSNAKMNNDLFVLSLINENSLQ